MITPEFASTMARYNQWQNESIYSAASLLDEDTRREDKGAFFGSIHATLCHLLWGDQIWMHRFAGTPKPAAKGIADSGSMIEDWKDLCTERKKMDVIITNWADELSSEFLAEELGWYSGSQQRQIVAKKGMLVAHMFNHQTHHRGQVHALITAAGGVPEDTDLFLLQ